MDCSPLGYFVHGISQARILKGVAISFSRGLPDPGIEPMFSVSPALQADSLPTESIGKPIYMCVCVCVCVCVYWRRKWQPTPVFLPGEFHGKRNLAGYSPWGHRVRYD